MPRNRFVGFVDGYVFTTRESGTGYYLDSASANWAAAMLLPLFLLMGRSRTLLVLCFFPALSTQADATLALGTGVGPTAAGYVGIGGPRLVMGGSSVLRNSLNWLIRMGLPPRISALEGSLMTGGVRVACGLLIPRMPTPGTLPGRPFCRDQLPTACASRRPCVLFLPMTLVFCSVRPALQGGACRPRRLTATSLGVVLADAPLGLAVALDALRLS